MFGDHADEPGLLLVLHILSVSFNSYIVSESFKLRVNVLVNKMDLSFSWQSFLSKIRRMVISVIRWVFGGFFEVANF